MRILHVVTLVSDDGAFGGPLTVAMNQTSELQGRGHDVVLAAGWRGSGQHPRRLRGVPAVLFPVHPVAPTGLTGLVSPRLIKWLRRNLRTFDVVHVHAGRDLVTLPAMWLASRARVPYVTQTHGMVMPDGRRIAKLLDGLATRKLLKQAARALVLTDAEAAGLPAVEPSARIVRLPNGVPLPQNAAGGGSPPEVLFCARLHARKRPLAFVEMAALLARRVPDAVFRMVGPDEGELGHVLAAIADRQLDGRVVYEGALQHDAVLDRMARAAVYVLPSVDEPFPMSLLEALSLGIPSVCTDSCGIAGDLRERGAAIVTDGSPEQMASAVERVLHEPSYASELRTAGRATAEQVYSIEAVVDRLEAIYADVLGDVPDPTTA